LAHTYLNKFHITRLFHTLYIIRDGEPAEVLKVQRARTPCTHNHRAALSPDAVLNNAQPMTS